MDVRDVAMKAARKQVLLLVVKVMGDAFKFQPQANYISQGHHSVLQNFWVRAAQNTGRVAGPYGIFSAVAEPPSNPRNIRTLSDISTTIS